MYAVFVLWIGIEQGELELALYPISVESFEMVGMIMDTDAPPPYTIVVKSGRREERFETDEVNLFRIPRITSGQHELLIYSGKELIGTTTIEL